MDEEYYNDWYNDEKESLQEAFLESYTKTTLIKLIIEAEGDLFEYLEAEFDEYCGEQFSIYREEVQLENDYYKGLL